MGKKCLEKNGLVYQEPTVDTKTEVIKKPINPVPNRLILGTLFRPIGGQKRTGYLKCKNPPTLLIITFCGVLIYFKFQVTHIISK